MKVKSVLVTGGAGFIGSHLIDQLLLEGLKVVGLDNFELGRPENLAHLTKNPNFQFRELDILDRKKLRRLFASQPFDAVFHLAANSDIARGGADTERDLRLTFLTTFEVLDAMRENGVNQIVFASSSAVYGDRDDELGENSGPLHPVSFYGAGKMAAEAYISAYAHNFGIQAQFRQAL